MRSPTLLPIRMNAAETRASRAIADWTLLTVVLSSLTTAEIDTFMIEVSTTRTNIAIASRIGSRLSAAAGSATWALAVVVMRCILRYARPPDGLGCATGAGTQNPQPTRLTT